MNKLVRENYPTSNLPADLGEGFDPARPVRVTVEQEKSAGTSLVLSTQTRQVLQAIGVDLDQVRPVSIADIRKVAVPRGTTPRQAVRRIRRLRDEWPD